MIGDVQDEIIPVGNTYTLRLKFPLSLYGNSQNTGLPGSGTSTDARAKIFWFSKSPATEPCYCAQPIFTCCPGDPVTGLKVTCGLPGGSTIDFDTGYTFVEITGLQCGNLPNLGTLSFTVNRCWAPFQGCERRDRENGIDLTPTGLAQKLGCPVPPPDDCSTSSNECRDCRPAGDGCSVSPDGGLSCTFPASGAHLRYRSGGAGGDGFPGTPAWRTALGLYFSHDYAQRIVQASGINDVFLITEGASFREFKNPPPSGTLRKYDATQTAPSDEYRQLYYNASTLGWELDYLDGRRDFFRPDGQWEKTTYASDVAVPPHPKVATYNGSNQLTFVDFPDGRREKFEYYTSGPSTGKLFKLTEIGVGVADCAVAPPGDCRSWTYSWSGDQLTTVLRPDGTVWELTYDPARAGYLTQVLLKTGVSGPGRVQAAFTWNTANRIERAWRGDPSFTGLNAIDKQEFSYTNPTLPTQTVVTEWVQDTPSLVTFTTTYALGRDSRSVKARTTSLSGACGACGLTPNTTFEYTNATHPLRASAMVDAKANRTEYSYTAEGRLASKKEAVGSAVERLTTYEHSEPITPSSSFKGLLTAIQVPSTSSGFRRTEMNYNDTTGLLETRTIKGNEVGGPANFTPAAGLVTTFTNNASGAVASMDPPDPGGTDVTTFTYNEANVPGRNGHLPDSRIDPLPLGPTHPTQFRYDALNRRTKVIDPNNVETETNYDEMGRVKEIRRKGLVAADDLVTTYKYDCPSGPPGSEPPPDDPPACREFRDLRCVELPRGNAIEYRYDAMGRLTAVTRKTNCLDTTQPLERTLYTLDKLGNRTLEQLQRWTGSSWTTDSVTEYQYSSRCHVDKVVRGKGEPYESTTEYCYDKNNNLEKIWDANHPSGAFPLGFTRYEYDARDRLLRVTQPWGPTANLCDPNVGGTNCATTTYEYDVQDHLKKVTDAEKNETSYETSDRDLLTKETAPAFSGTPVSGCGSANCRQLTYNKHGLLSTERDPRNVLVTRSYDDLDRLTLVDYPSENTLDTTYSYDGLASEFKLGRLAAISRDGGTSVIAYGYDRFGRLVQDGALGYAYDRNGNRTEVRYPNGLAACYDYELFADRESTLAWSSAGGPTPCAAGTSPIVNGASYYASGPLRSLSLANGIMETREYDKRYFADRIAAGSLFDWDYQYSVGASTDRVGNVLKIDELNGAATDRIYTYQDHQYFLTGGNGPWGNQGWTYDKIGNRKTETDSTTPVPATYTYVTTALGNTPRLFSISPPPNRASGTRTFGFDAAGNQTTIADSGGELFGTDTFTYSEESRLKKLSLNYGPAESAITYDGQGFLRKAELTYTTPGSTEVERAEPTYSSSGLLFARHGFKQRTPRNPETGMSIIVPPIDKTTDIFYFAGRPVAQRTTFVDGAPGFLYLTTDHLGTPVIATDTGGTQVWPSWKVPNSPTAGGLEPFGGMFAFAEGTEVFLRFPGQWEDGTWKTSARAAGIYYNLHRWLDSNIGRYGQPDPIGLHGGVNVFGYALGNPVKYSDRLGLDTAGCDVGPLAKHMVESLIGSVDWDSPCVLQCCAAHDACYDNSGCSSGSWGMNLGTPNGGKGQCKPSECKQCNDDVVRCVVTCRGRTQALAPGGPIYYCGAQHRYINIPGPGVDSPDQARISCEADYTNCCERPSRQ